MLDLWLSGGGNLPCVLEITSKTTTTLTSGSEVPDESLRFHGGGLSRADGGEERRKSWKQPQGTLSPGLTEGENKSIYILLPSRPLNMSPTLSHIQAQQIKSNPSTAPANTPLRLHSLLRLVNMHFFNALASFAAFAACITPGTELPAPQAAASPLC